MEAPPRSRLSDAETKPAVKPAASPPLRSETQHPSRVVKNLLGVTFPPTVHSDSSFISAHRHPIPLQATAPLEYWNTAPVLKDPAAPARRLIRSKALVAIGDDGGTRSSGPMASFDKSR